VLIIHFIISTSCRKCKEEYEDRFAFECQTLFVTLKRERIEGNCAMGSTYR
jgi:hypothetical protein